MTASVVGNTSMGRTIERTFDDKVVWITGASSGIGRALALALHRQSARLILSARNPETLEEVARACTGDSDVHLLPLDLNARDTLSEKVQTALEHAGRIDYVIHNAGVASRDLAVDTSLDVDRQIMETNYFGPIALTKAILPAMLERGSGCFVVVSSLSGKYGAPLISAYAASKHALHGFFESLRAEVHDANIQVTIVIPGFVKTPITVSALTGDGSQYGKMMTVHERGMMPEECAERILKAVVARKQEALVGGVEVLSVHALRLSRRWLSRVIRSHPVRLRDTVLRFVSLGRYGRRD